jgi:hypothetical protein
MGGGWNWLRMNVYWQTLILVVLNLLVLLPDITCTGSATIHYLYGFCYQTLLVRVLLPDITCTGSLFCPLFTGCIPERDILWYLVFTGFAVNYVFRLNINIGIVSMVKSRPPKLGNISHSSVCIQSQTPLSSYNSSTNITTIALHLPDEVSC